MRCAEFAFLCIAVVVSCLTAARGLPYASAADRDGPMTNAWAKSDASLSDDLRARLKGIASREQQGKAQKNVLQEDRDLDLLDRIDHALGGPLKKALLEVLDETSNGGGEKKSESEPSSSNDAAAAPISAYQSSRANFASEKRKTGANIASEKRKTGTNFARIGQRAHPVARVLVAGDAKLTSAGNSQRHQQDPAASTSHSQTKITATSGDRSKKQNDAVAKTVQLHDATSTANKETVVNARGQRPQSKTRFLVAPGAPLTEKKALAQEIAEKREFEERMKKQEQEDDERNREMDDADSDEEGEEEYDPAQDENNPVDTRLSSQNEAVAKSQQQMDTNLDAEKENLVNTRGQQSQTKIRFLVAPDAPMTEDNALAQEAAAKREFEERLRKQEEEDDERNQEMDDDEEQDQAGYDGYISYQDEQEAFEQEDEEISVKGDPDVTEGQGYPDRVEQVPVREPFYPEQDPPPNNGAKPAGRGLEVDQASRAAASAYIHARKKEDSFHRRFLISPDAPLSDTKNSRESVAKKNKDAAEEKVDLPLELVIDDEDESDETEKRAWTTKRTKCDLVCVNETVECSNKTLADRNSPVKCGYNSGLTYHSVSRTSATECSARYRLKVSCSRAKHCFYTRGCYGLFKVHYCYPKCDFAYHREDE